MHSEIVILKSLLESQYQINNAPVAFIDESYREEKRNDGYPFYTITATLIPATQLAQVRKDYLKFVGESRWHTTSSFLNGDDEKIIGFVELISKHRAELIVAVQVEIFENNLEHARRECLVQSLAHLQSLGCRLVVIERREDTKSRNADEALVTKAKGAGYINRNLRVMQSQPSAEQLLWGPDLVGWALRRYLALNEHAWISPLVESLQVIDASQAERLKEKRPAPAAAMGSGPASPVNLKGKVANRSSLKSMARPGDTFQSLSPLFSQILRPKHVPQELDLWLRNVFPNRLKLNS